MSYTDPLLSVVFLMILAGALRLPKGAKRRWILIGLGCFFLVASPPADWLLSRHLEAWYPIRPFPAAPADAIVVLSSSVERPHYERPFPLADTDTYTRCRFAAWLHQRWKPLPVLACGGGASKNAPAFAATMREILMSVGVPNASIWTEERSRSTYENALYGAEVLRSHGISRIVLVVEAQSMPRAAACFRKQGIAVVPAPSEFGQWNLMADGVLLSWKSVRRNDITLHETLGLLWYKLLGRI